MTSLFTPPFAPLLDRLFDEAAAISPFADSALATLSAEDLAKRMQSRTGYADFYTRLKDAPLAVSKETGRLLYILARSCGARSIVEFGTSFGLSTLHLAAALRDNGGGKVITTEFEPSKAARARANLVAGGVADLVEIREGDALQTLADGLPESVDLLFLDGAKALYPDILRLVEGHLRPGALIVADNADHSPDYLALVRAPGHGYVSTPIGTEIELSQRIG